MSAGYNWGAIGGDSVTLGRFDENGAVIGGDAVLVGFVDLGSAPASHLSISGLMSDDGRELFGTRDQPVVFGVLQEPASGTNLSDRPVTGLLAHFSGSTAGASGVAQIGYALLTSSDESLESALGVTVPLRVVVEEQGDGSVGIIGPDTWHTFQPGGASHFAPTPAYQISSFAQPVNDGATMNASVFKLRSTVPVKFSVLDRQGHLLDAMSLQQLSETCAVRVVADPEGGTVTSLNEEIAVAASASSNCARVDPTTGQFIFNWSTRGLTRQWYRLSVTVSSGGGPMRLVR